MTPRQYILLWLVLSAIFALPIYVMLYRILRALQTLVQLLGR
jgi:hypothetical protein